jgi:uncharacterized protein with NRDE domain
MCSIILRIEEEGVYIGANRDEMLDRPWAPPAEFWPGIIAGRDELGKGTWLGMNRHGVAAAVLNRTGTLGPAPDKKSRGLLPLMALNYKTAAIAVTALRGLNTEAYRSFNLVVADATGATLLRGLEFGTPTVRSLPRGVTMITSGEPNDFSLPRIARHQPKFVAAPFSDWGKLLADGSGDRNTALNIPEHDGFGTICSSLIALPAFGAPEWQFAPGHPDTFEFAPVEI